VQFASGLTGPATLPVAVNPTGLPNGTYNANINVQTAGQSFVVPVTLNVTSSTGGGGGGGGGGSSTIAGPTSLSFASQIGVSTPIYQQVTIAPSGSFTASATTTTGTGWLVLGTSAGTGPASLLVQAVPGGLTAGTYSGTISIVTPSGSQNVSVTLQIATTAVLVQNPGSINLTLTPSSGTQTSSFQLSASDNSNQSVTVTSNASWITIAGSTSNTTPAAFTIQINPATLCNGVNTGTLTATAGTANSPVTIPVVVLISGASTTCTGGGGGNLTLGASSLTFNAAVNGSSQQQTLGVTATTATNFTVSFSVNTGFNWLSVATQNGSNILSGTTLTTPQNLIVTANPLGLSQATYTGQIVLTANGVSQTVPITFNVGTGGGGSGNITVSPTQVSFSPAAGSTTPVNQNIVVTGNNVGYIYTATTTSGGNWLSGTSNGQTLVNGASLNTTTNNTITIVANPSGLQAGTYNGSITLSPNGGTQVTVPVSLTISSPNTVTATPTTLTLSYQAGSTVPTGQIQVAGSTTGLTFSAQATSTGNWLTVSPAAGTTPATLSVSINPASLTAGTYTGTIQVNGTGTATGSTTVTVTLTVTAPLPTITQIGNSASYIGGNVSPGEIITIFGTALGPTPAIGSPTIDPTTGLVSTTLGNVQVLINGFLAPMLYVSNTQVSAVVPYELARFLSATIQVKFLGQTSNGISAGVTPTIPGIFTLNASGTGPAAVLNGNLSVNGPSNPAARGETIAIYLTGEGQTSPPGVTGSVTKVSATPPLTPVPLLPVAVRIDNQPAAISFAGEAPGFVAGIMQLNVTIPTTVPDTGAVPLQVTIGGTNSQANVTIFVK
jgi:uncharacterized protein (TIGR03437 family)